MWRAPRFCSLQVGIESSTSRLSENHPSKTRALIYCGVLVLVRTQGIGWQMMTLKGGAPQMNFHVSRFVSLLFIPVLYMRYLRYLTDPFFKVKYVVRAPDEGRTLF